MKQTIAQPIFLKQTLRIVDMLALMGVNRAEFETDYSTLFIHFNEDEDTKKPRN